MSKQTAVPLAALLTSAALAIVLAAQTSLSCTDKIAVSLPGDAMGAMPGMDMAAMHGSAAQPLMMICPVVLVLVAVSALLAAAAAVMLWRDPHRALAQRAVVLALSQLPPVRTVGTVALAGGSAVGAMLWVEQAALPAFSIDVMLVALLLACSLAATFGAIAAGRIALTLGRRLIVAIAAAIAQAGEAVAPPAQAFVPVAAGGHAAVLLAAGRGLRAPPLFVR